MTRIDLTPELASQMLDAWGAPRRLRLATNSREQRVRQQYLLEYEAKQMDAAKREYARRRARGVPTVSHRGRGNPPMRFRCTGPEWQFLTSLARKHGQSMSMLIRRALERVYGMPIGVNRQRSVQET